MNKILVSFFLLFALLGLSQKPHHLIFSNNSHHVFKKNPENHFKDSASTQQYINDLIYFGIKKGYLLTSIDSIRHQEDLTTISMYVGPKFKSAKLKLSKEDARMLRQIGSYTEKLLANLAFSPQEIAKTLQRIQRDLENNGYPFASVSLDSLIIDNTNLQAKLLIEKGPSIKWIKINMRGENFVSMRLLSSYMHIKVGDTYNQSDVQLISARLKQISFIEEIKPAEILFTKEGAELFLYLKSKPVSLANGVIGLQPNPASQKIMLTGDIRLKLVNVLKKAESIELNWKSIQAQTQALKAQMNVPNLFSSPFGIDGQFQMYKRDSSFLELKSTLGIQYALNNGSYLKAFYRNNSSSVLKGGVNNPTFSNLGTVKTNSYGLSLYKQTLDYIPNPRKGFSLLTDVSIGKRKSRKSDTSLVVSNTTYRAELKIDWFLPLAKRHVIRLANHSEFYLAPVFYQNESIRFGGQNSLRGFNEEEMRATSNSLFSVEYRFLVDQNSFAFLFYDQAWYENQTNAYYKDTPLGFGLGFSFGTNIGTFSISYALGKQYNNPILFKDGKVHFGYIAYF
jgi:outer membrane protein assembly factor BamA